MKKKNPKTLSFFANPDSNSLINDHEALANNIIRYIGRKWVLTEPAKTNTLHPELSSWGTGEFQVTEEPTTINFNPNYNADYIQAVRNNEIIPANQETADFCGVPFISITKTE